MISGEIEEVLVGEYAHNISYSTSTIPSPESNVRLTVQIDHKRFSADDLRNLADLLEKREYEIYTRPHIAKIFPKLEPTNVSETDKD